MIYYLIKEFKTIDEQIEILKSRGLAFNDEEFAKEKLLVTNYYNTINGYKKLFIDMDENNNEIVKSNANINSLQIIYTRDIISSKQRGYLYVLG